MSTPTRRTRSGCCAPRRERPYNGRAADERDELASLHSITSSARRVSLCRQLFVLIRDETAASRWNVGPHKYEQDSHD
jgi:hypothetical protein